MAGENGKRAGGQAGSQGAGSGSGAGTGEKDGGGQVDLTGLNSKLDAITKKLEAGDAASKEDQALIEKLLAGDDDGSTKEGKKEVTDSDIDSMSNSQVMKLLSKDISARLDDIERKLVARVDTVDADNANTQVLQEVKDARAEFGDDFDKNLEEITAIAKEHPDLSARQAYLLATAPASRKKLSEVSEAGKKKGAAAVDAMVKDGTTSEALTKEIAGKTVKETAESIARQIGLE